TSELKPFFFSLQTLALAVPPILEYFRSSILGVRCWRSTSLRMENHTCQATTQATRKC
ncbi:hypothetical protein Zm00014a_042905, partial [Zea mays]